MQFPAPNRVSEIRNFDQKFKFEIKYLVENPNFLSKKKTNFIENKIFSRKSNP